MKRKKVKNNEWFYEGIWWAKEVILEAVITRKSRSVTWSALFLPPIFKLDILPHQLFSIIIKFCNRFTSFIGTF